MIEKHNKRRIILISLVIVVAVFFAVFLSSCNLSGQDEVVTKIYVEDFANYKVKINEPIDLSLIKLKVYYKSGRIEHSVPVDSSMIEDYDKTIPGIQTITAKYKGVKTSFIVEFVYPVITRVSLETVPNDFHVIEGMDLKMDGVEIKVEYEDGGSNIIKNIKEGNVLGYNKALSPGVHEITIKYFESTLKLNLTVKPKEIVSIKKEREPNKTDYLIGDEFEPLGLEFNVVYNNETVEVIRYEDDQENYSFEYDFSMADSYSPVKVNYKNKSTTIYVYVTRATIKSIGIQDITQIETQPVALNGVSTVYKFNNPVPEGVRLNSNAGGIRITYDDDTIKDVNLSDPLVSVYVKFNPDIPNNPTIDKNEYRFKQADKKLIFKYENHIALVEFNIAVVAKSAVKLDIVDPDNILAKKYYNGNNFDDSLLKYNVLYNNGLHKTFIYASTPIESQYKNWSSINELKKESSLALSTDSDVTEDGFSVKTLTYSLDEARASIQVKVYPKVVIRDSIYIKEPERTYQTVSQIDQFPDKKPAVSGAYVSYVVEEGGQGVPNKIYFNNNSVRYYQGNNEITNFSTPGQYKAKANIMTHQLDFPFEVEYDFEIGVDSYDLIELGRMENSSFVDIGIHDEVRVDNTNDFVLASYYVRLRKTGESSFETPEQLTANHIYAVRKDSVALENQGLDLKTGSNFINIRHKGLNRVLQVYVEGQNIRGISVLQAPKVYYQLGDESFDNNGLVIALVNIDGSINLITDNDILNDRLKWKYTGYNLNQLGKQKVTITYTPSNGLDYSTTYEIEVSERVVTGISFNDNQFGMQTVDGQKVLMLKKGDILNNRFIETVTLASGDTKDEIRTLMLNVSYGATTEQVELKTEYVEYEAWHGDAIHNGVKDAKINYAGKSCPIKIYISDEISFDSIKIFSKPTRQNFIEFEDPDLEGGIFELIYKYNGNEIRQVRSLSEAYVRVTGYDKNIHIQSKYISQINKVHYLSYSAEFDLVLNTYKKIDPEFTLSGTINSYGASTDIGVDIAKVADFSTPNYIIEYMVDGSWQNAAPKYPGEYSIRITILPNKYYNLLISEDKILTINKKEIVIILNEIGKSKQYKAADPIFKNCIALSGQPMQGDAISFEIVRSNPSEQAVGEYQFSIIAPNSESNNNSYYNFIISPTFFKIVPRKVMVADLGATISSGVLSIKSGTHIITSSDFTVYNMYDEEISNINNMTPGSYYLKLKNNYLLYNVVDGKEVLVANKRWDFTLSN